MWQHRRSCVQRKRQHTVKWQQNHAAAAVQTTHKAGTTAPCRHKNTSKELRMCLHQQQHSNRQHDKHLYQYYRRCQRYPGQYTTHMEITYSARCSSQYTESAPATARAICSSSC
jgi:hypothetical protein